ncbi:MAG TPA: Asp-tRNA(Asn)/Glu-tRNA(Gln) amidotransferase subunit GatB [Phycisphaerae bacterium]|jgi:aspartyl-tRNA(Asn)/glutamyl-tRNA(Gln) amidotransferase subunit B|nr:Asp-tRNA(Asn)/Glu-tRNA(Gln) amidotransferase subunit GatB [Phycisphaerae bacterium]
MTNATELTVEPIIGLEIHVQLATRTKMFCGCPLEFGAPPNTRVCPVCLGLPGALPVINRQAVELAVRAALALNCRIATFTKWDRKNYYYPDLPKNYQISQYDLPISSDGYFELTCDGRQHRVGIIRAHLEEDAGKNVHDFPGYTGVDLNRAGTPLLEIVTQPDLHSADEAREFAVQLQRLVRYLGVSEANMQEGHMRFEPNINLRIISGGQEFRTPIVEVKNLNSFRSLYLAVQYEIDRQLEQWRETGETAAMGNKSNRGWDDVKEITLPQREKEEAHDYRYFPDPDLVPMTFDPAWVGQLQSEMPELPIRRTERFVAEYRIPAQDAPALVDDRRTADLLDSAAAAGGDKVTLAKHFLSFWAKHANERGTTVAGLGIAPQRLAELANLVQAGKVNATAAAQIAEAMLSSSDSPTALAERLGVLQSRDTDQIAAWVDQALAANAQAVQDAIANPKKIKAARGFLTGQVMKLSGGKADPKIVGELIEKKLAEKTGGNH